GAGGLLGQLAGLERDLLPLDLDGHARNGVRHIQFPSCSALRSAECFSFSSLVPNGADGSGGWAEACAPGHPVSGVMYWSADWIELEGGQARTASTLLSLCFGSGAECKTPRSPHRTI